MEWREGKPNSKEAIGEAITEATSKVLLEGSVHRSASLSIE